MRGIRLALVLLIAVAAVPTAGSSGGGDPTPLRGRPLGADTGLRLLVASDPPFVLDVDENRVETLRGAPHVNRRRGALALSVVGVGGRGGAILLDYGFEASVYGVSSRGARVAPLGRARQVWPADDSALWVQQSLRRSRCTLRRVTLTGRVTRRARPFPCAGRSDPAGGLGVVVGRTRVVDPITARTIFTAPRGILAVAKHHVLLSGPGRRFTLIDTRSSARKFLAWPSTIGGGDEPAVDPRGRYIAVAFANPAWQGGGQQVLDVWLLDTQTSQLTHVPGMPAFVALKQTSMGWTDDGRLVLLGESRRTLVAVWRPGEARLGVKAVALPERNAGSDSFAVLR